MRIVVTHMSTDGNRGDFAILAATIRKLRERFPEAQISTISVERGRTFAESDVRLTRPLGVEILGTLEPPRAAAGSLPGWVAGLAGAELGLAVFRLLGKRSLRVMPARARAFFSALGDADLVVAKGGSYLYAYEGWRQTLYLMRMIYPLRAAIAAGKPPILLGVSLGPFASRIEASAARRVLRRCRFVYLREELSEEVAVTALGLPRERTDVIPDVAFSLPGPAGARERRGVGVTVRDLPFWEASDRAAARQEYRAAIVATVGDLLERHPGETVTFVPQAAHDADLARQLVAEIGNPERALVLDRDFTLEEIVETYAGFRFVIATRLHSLILSAVAGTPALHIAYERQKGIGIIRMLGLEAWVIPASEVGGGRLAELVASFEDDLGSISERLSVKLEELRASLDAVFAHL